MRKLQIAAILALLLAPGCQSPQPDTIETQMYFGLSRPDDRQISETEWQDFVDRSITPRFPGGMTILYGDGQYRANDGTIRREPSAMLVVLHGHSEDSKLDTIAREFDRRFNQESVLRADFPVRMEFIAGDLTHRH